jgi:hypothetical protein
MKKIVVEDRVGFTGDVKVREGVRRGIMEV